MKIQFGLFFSTFNGEKLGARCAHSNSLCRGVLRRVVTLNSFFKTREFDYDDSSRFIGPFEALCPPSSYNEPAAIFRDHARGDVCVFPILLPIGHIDSNNEIACHNVSSPCSSKNSEQLNLKERSQVLSAAKEQVCTLLQVNMKANGSGAITVALGPLATGLE